MNCVIIEMNTTKSTLSNYTEWNLTEFNVELNMSEWSLNQINVILK